MKRGFFAILFIIIVFKLSAQITYPGKPVSLNTYDFSEVPVISPACTKRDKSVSSNKPSSSLFKSDLNDLFCEINLSYTDFGVWVSRKDGTRIWRAGIFIKDIPSIGLVFTRFNLQKGVRIFVYDKDQYVIRGAYTYKNNKNSGVLAISAIPSNLIYIEMQVLPFVKNPGEFELGYVAYDQAYRKSTEAVEDTFFRFSGECNVDVNCYQDADIQTVKYSVVRIVYDGDERCTGTLVNTTREDSYPFLLTAGHCIDNQTRANNAIFYFNYESPTCGGPDGKNSFSISGSKLLATTNGNLDFSLLELSEPLPYYYHPYFAGWDKRNLIASSSYTIHHPLGDVKKISIENHPVETADYGDGYDFSTHWLVPHWEVGTTERGSSGCALFDQNNRIVGTLTGGWARCGNSVDDYFQKFYNCWSDYPETANQLKFWLDPLHTNQDYIDGYDPYRNFWLSGDTISNIMNNEIPELYKNSFDWGYLSGHNSDHITMYAEKFNSPKSINILEIQVGTGKVYATTDTSFVRFYVWNSPPDENAIIYTENVLLADMASDDIYRIDPAKPLNVNNDFYIGYQVFYQPQGDTFAVKMSLRDDPESNNSAFLNNNGTWQLMSEYPGISQNASLDISVLIYDSVPENPGPDTLPGENDVLIYPNPATSKVTITFWELPKFDIPVNLYNVAGQLIKSEVYMSPGIEIEYNFNKIPTGIYFLKMNVNNLVIRKKILVIRD